MEIKGKYYDNNFVALLSTFLYNVRWISVFALLCNVLPTLEKATTEYGIDGETCFWGICWTIFTICLIAFHKKLAIFYDCITDKIYSAIN